VRAALGTFTPTVAQVKGCGYPLTEDDLVGCRGLLTFGGGLTVKVAKNLAAKGDGDLRYFREIPTDEAGPFVLAHHRRGRHSPLRRRALIFGTGGRQPAGIRLDPAAAGHYGPHEAPVSVTSRWHTRRSTRVAPAPRAEAGLSRASTGAATRALAATAPPAGHKRDR